MENKDKELLLKDLCGRLPYGVKCENFNHAYGKNVFKVTDIRDNGYICGTINNKHGWAVFDPLELKPYLFPISSVTEEQAEKYGEYYDIDLKNSAKNLKDILDGKDVINGYPMYNHIDWLNRNHFDYRGLIEKGLAIDCTNLNIY